MQRRIENAAEKESVSESELGDSSECSTTEKPLSVGAPSAQHSSPELEQDSGSVSHQNDPHSRPVGRPSVPHTGEKSDISPATKTVLFETGNPETGATPCGALETVKVSGTVDTVLVESVPGLMTAPDFCMFIQPFADTIVHFRPLRVRTERNRYIVIMKFRSSEEAAKFARSYQGRPFFPGLVEETCNVREVGSIDFDTANDSELSGFPNSAMFPGESDDALRATCAVCLERLDARNDALVTTFCNHTMHAACLSKWDLNRCPVCRHTHELRPESSVCMICNHRGHLWMCAVCGFVGCAIYANKHAHAHFDETQHPFAINLEDRTFWGGETIRAGTVWDYSSERFVNRLLTSDDGKVVEVAQDPERSPQGAPSVSQAAACCSSENVGIVEDEENDRGLQAAVYASRMDAIVDEYRGKLEWLEAERVAEKNELENEIVKLKGAVTKGSKEKKVLQKRISEMEKETKQLEDKNGFLKNLSDTLLRDNRGWNEQVEGLKRQLAESEEAKKGLQEQIRDLMMHLEAQAKISEASGSCRSGPSELQGGDVRVGPTPRQRLAMKTHRR